MEDDPFADLREEIEADRLRRKPPKSSNEYRKARIARMSDAELSALRAFNAKRQREYLAKVRPTWTTEYKQRRNRKTTEYAIAKRLRTATRPKPDECEVCGLVCDTVYEHSHKTGKFRGWTCNKCNVALAMVDDNIETLTKLILYLRAHDE